MCQESKNGTFEIYPFFMIWNDAADKVGVGIPQGGHQFGQLLLIELSNSTEHAFLGF